MNAIENYPIQNEWPVYPVTREHIPLFNMDPKPTIPINYSAIAEKYWNSEKNQKKLHKVIDSGSGLHKDSIFAKNFPWVQRLYDLENMENPLNALIFLFENMENLLEAKQFDSIDIIFQNIDLKKLSPDILIGMLRIVSPAKEDISSFPMTIAKVQKELVERNIDPKSLLSGLLIEE